MADTFSVLSGRPMKRITEADLQKSVEEAQAKARSEISAEVKLRETAEARVAAAEAACAKACADRDAAISQRDIAKASVSEFQNKLNAITAQIDALRAAINSKPDPVFPEIPRYDDSELRGMMDKIQKAVSAIRIPPAPKQSVAPARPIPEFDLQVTARDQNGAILNVRAVPK